MKSHRATTIGLHRQPLALTAFVLAGCWAVPAPAQAQLEIRTVPGGQFTTLPAGQNI